jgi:hypothetical protein
VLAWVVGLAIKSCSQKAAHHVALRKNLGLAQKVHALKSPTARFYPPMLVLGAGPMKKRL